MAGIERNNHQQKQQNRYAKAGAQTRQRKSSTGPPALSTRAQIYKNQVVSCGDAPSQRQHRWFCILYRSSWSRPCAWVLPWSSPIPPPLSHSIDARRNFLTPLHSPPPRPLWAVEWEDRYQFMTVGSNPPIRKKPPRGLVV